MPPRQANNSGGDDQGVTIIKIVTTVVVAAVKIALCLTHSSSHCPSWGWWPMI